MDVDGRAEVIEDLIERAKPSVVAPAVDVGGLDVENLFTEAFGDKLRDTCLAGTAGPGNDGRVGGLLVRDGLEDAGEVIDLSIAMFNLLRDEPSPEYTSIADHLLSERLFFWLVLKT